MAMTMPPETCMMGREMPKKARREEPTSFDDGEEDDGIDGDSASEGAIGIDGRMSDEAEEDERGAEGIDERKKSAEAQSKVFPE